FRQAARKVGLDSLLPVTGYFTLFAPVDSAMIAAGLDSARISLLPADSLSEIIGYHVVEGAYADASLTAAVASIQAATLRQDVSYNVQQANTYVYQQYLYIKKTGVLYVNGE